MADKPKPQRRERFTMLEMGGPTNPSPEELATRVVGLAFKERFTMLEMGGPTNPSPEELATRIVEPLINGFPPAPELRAELPRAVVNLVAELAAVVAALDERERVAALDYISTKISKRVAG